MARRLADCRRCRLCQKRTQVVFGVGNPKARVVFVGEGPGADEDRIGEPFVGRAGQLLNVMLPSIGLRREDVYIANIVKCRPPGNRDPETDEAAACMPFLKRQIELINPEVIVLLGRIAARFLLGTTAPISSYRGKWTIWHGHAVLPTYHTAYLLRNPAAKRESWVDFKQLRLPKKELEEEEGRVSGWAGQAGRSPNARSSTASRYSSLLPLPIDHHGHGRALRTSLAVAHPLRAMPRPQRTSARPAGSWASGAITTGTPSATARRTHRQSRSRRNG